MTKHRLPDWPTWYCGKWSHNYHKRIEQMGIFSLNLNLATHVLYSISNFLKNYMRGKFKILFKKSKFWSCVLWNGSHWCKMDINVQCVQTCLGKFNISLTSDELWLSVRFSGPSVLSIFYLCFQSPWLSICHFGKKFRIHS